MALPNRADLSTATNNAGAEIWLKAVYDFIAQRFQFGTAGVSAPSAADIQAARDSQGIGAITFRNRVLNGCMAIDQRNEGAAQTITAAAALAYCVDMHYAYCTGANVTGQQVAATDGTRRYRFTGAASVSAIGLGHRIEAADSLDLAGKTCTLSAKLTNSVLTSVAWAVYYANSADTFGTLASPTRTAIASGTFTVTSSEATYSTQVAVPAAATTGLEIVLSVGAQTSGTWTIGDLQLEAGTVPSYSIVVDRPPREELLRRCERYCEKSYAQGVVPGASTVYTTQICVGNVASITNSYTYGYAFFRTKKRATPTVVVYSAAGTTSRSNDDSNANYGAGSGTPVGQSQIGFGIQNGTGGTMTPSFAAAYFHYLATCPL